MMKTLSARQIQKLDKLAIERVGIPSICLMENAGRAAAHEAAALLKRVRKPKAGVFCGAGNNAGDGFVIARHLVNAGVGVDVMILTDPEKFKNDAFLNYRILKKIKVPVRRIRRFSADDLTKLSEYDLVIDAIFGVGLNRNIEGVYYDAIENINARAKKTLAVDVPSGLDATTGKIYGIAVRAHTTVTMTVAKSGFTKGAGPKLCGRVKPVDIGIPVSLIKKI